MRGVVTKSDIVAQISQCLGASCTTGVFSVMTRDVACCQQKDWLHDVWSIMKERQLKNDPITDDLARPIGILNARDALQALMQEVEQEESLLRDYVMCVGYADPHRFGCRRGHRQCLWLPQVRGSRTTLRRRRQRDYVTSNIVSRREESPMPLTACGSPPSR